MKFSLNKSIQILERTPVVLETLLINISDDWIFANEGSDSWSVFDIVGHLLHGEKTDWIQRMDNILSDSTDKTFTPFDRFAQFEESKGRTLEQIIAEFKEQRMKNLEYLRSKNLSESDLSKTGIHPVFGEVTLSQLLSTWTVHDLNHLAQISRVLAKQYKAEVGPWIEFLRILKS